MFLMLLYITKTYLCSVDKDICTRYTIWKKFICLHEIGCALFLDEVVPALQLQQTSLYEVMDGKHVYEV